MTESAPSYGVRPATPAVQLLARVLDCDVDELIDRALEEAFDRSLADPDIKAAFDALSRLDARRVAREQAAADASADYGMRDTRPEETEEAGHVERGDGFTHSGPAESCCTDEDDATEEEDQAPPPVRVKGPTLTTEQRQRSASVVRQARIDRALSQVEVAQQLGVSPATVSMIERAAHAVAATTVRSAVRWAQAE